MPNKDRQKRSVRQARAREREALEAAQAAAAGPATSSKRGSVPAKSEAKKPAKAKEGFFARARTYLREVRTEMHRVVWPSRTELKNYSIAVIAMLLVAGIAIWLVDTGFVAILLGLTGLRG